jgi:spermidine synthase
MLIGWAVLIAGAVLMATEILAFRVIGRTFGSALRETTAVIAVFLTAMSSGYYLGGRMGDRRPDRRTIIRTLLFAAGWIALLPEFHTRISERIALSSLPAPTHALVAAFVLFALPTAALAAVSPIAIRLRVRDVQTSGSVAGGMAAASSFGSILGTIVTGFWLLGAFPVSGILRGLAILLVLVAGILWIARRRAGTTAALAWVIPLLLPGGPRAEIIFTRDTAYHHIRVEDSGVYRILHFDDTDQSRMRLDDPLDGGYEYTSFFHLATLFTVPRRVLFVGLGGGTGPKQFLADYPDAEIEVAEVDPVVIEVAREYFALPEDRRLTIGAMDGRVFLRKSNERYDVIAVDAYTSGKYGSSIPFQMTTLEFFELCHDRLNDDGVVVYNVIERPRGSDSEFLRALTRTLGEAFAEQYLFECQTSNNSVIVACRRKKGLDQAGLLSRARDLVREGRVKRSDFLDSAASLFPGPLDVTGSPVLTDDYAPVDQLLAR